MPRTVAAIVAACALTGVALAVAPVALADLAAPTARPQSTALASIDLGQEFPDMAGYRLTLFLTTLPPGGGLKAHPHKGAPEIVHIVSGTLTDARNGGPPITYGPGSTLINDGSVTHATLNQGQDPVVYYTANVRRN
jgi:quercetin dioxygenase-like cupin family protein